MKEVIDTEIKAKEWENITEEDYHNLSKKVTPRLLYFDTEGNCYHYILKKKAGTKQR